MARGKTDAQIKAALNRMAPGAADTPLGDVLYDLLAANAAIVTAYNALVAKLNADVGVTDTNYAVLPAAATVKMPAARS